MGNPDLGGGPVGIRKSTLQALTLATSETYWNKQDAKNVAQSIINQAGGGRIIENT